MSETIDNTYRLGKIIRAEAVAQAARVLVEQCDTGHLDEKERFILETLRERLEKLSEWEYVHS